uniref:Uncharacterized protein n=1 Tax=Anguilla anguilla TaxID=7936 RepID=A0A0E9VWW1_ANGAN
MFSLKNMHYIPYLVMVIGTYTSIYKIFGSSKIKKEPLSQPFFNLLNTAVNLPRPSDL